VIGSWLRIKIYGCGVQTPGNASNFSTLDCKKMNKAPSVRGIVICSDCRLLWWHSYKGVDHALASGELSAPDYYHHSNVNSSFFILFLFFRNWYLMILFTIQWSIQLPLKWEFNRDSIWNGRGMSIISGKFCYMLEDAFTKLRLENLWIQKLLNCKLPLNFVIFFFGKFLVLLWFWAKTEVPRSK